MSRMISITKLLLEVEIFLPTLFYKWGFIFLSFGKYWELWRYWAWDGLRGSACFSRGVFWFKKDLNFLTFDD